MYQLSFSLTQFLSHYWQKKPTVIKGGFKQFHDPLSPEELAGLTLEDEIDSRFVSNLDGDWVAEHGPLKESTFSSLAETNWSIIVQAANHWHSKTAELVTPFSTIPGWLFDDLMISYSVPGGGVGPHIDQYDVFIVQGQGKRHWRVGEKDQGQYIETFRAAALKQIESFDSIIDEVLEPGDILYIPPGFPHDGYAIEPSMSYSVGFRSPKQQELISNFADYVLAHDIGDVHLHKPELTTQLNSGEISLNDKGSLLEMLSSLLNDEQRVNEFMGCMLSQSRHQLNIIAPTDAWRKEEIIDSLFAGEHLERVAGLRAYYHEEMPSEIYINGEVFKLDDKLAALAMSLCNNASFSLEQTETPLSDEFVSLLQVLVNKGYWYFGHQAMTE